MQSHGRWTGRQVAVEGTGSRATARIQQGGPLSGVVRLLMGGLVEPYLVLSSAGLKACSEE